MPETWPLVGRGALLSSVAATARTRRRSGVVLVGPPGSGRTRFARAALAAVTNGPSDGRPWAPRWVMASAATARIPLGAMSHLLGGPGPGPSADPVDHVLQVARRRLVADAGEARLLLAVDDAHVLDPTSAVLLQQLAVAGEAFLIITAPTRAVVPEPIFALWKEGLADRLDLDGLGRAEHDELLAAALGGHVDEGSRRRLWELTLGNPLLLRELVDAGQTSGSLHRAGTVWRWNGLAAPTPRLVELVERRLGERSPVERDALALVAFGEPLGSDLLAELVAPEIVAGLEQDGLLTSEQRGRRVDLRLTQPLHAEILRRESTPFQARQAHRRLGEALERRGTRRSPDRARLAWWRIAQGLPPPAGEIVAVAETVLRTDPALAGRLLRAAVERGGTVDVRRRLGTALVHLGHVEEAEQVFAAAAEGTAPGSDEAVALALVRVPNLCWGLHDLPRAEAALALGDPGTDPPPDTAADHDLAVLRAYRAMIRGRLSEASRLLAPVVEDASAERTPAIALAALVAAASGEPDHALLLADRAEAVPSSPELDGGWHGFPLRTARWYAYVLRGDLDAAEGVAWTLRREALAEEAPGRASLAATWLGIVEGRRGRLRSAVHWLLEAAAGVRADRFPFTSPLAGELAIALASLGELDRARAVIAEGSVVPDRALFGGWLRAARIWVAGVAGRRRDALDEATAVIGQAGWLSALQCLHAVIRLGQAPAEVVAELERLAGSRAGQTARLYADHAKALAARDGPALEDAAEGFAKAGMMLLAADAAAQAAEAHRVGGATGRSRAAAARARAYTESCPGARTPALSLLDAGGELTPRESEIAALAAGGLTSRAIASRLVVSVRTVDNVLHSVYSKLGISGRTDLPDAVGLRPR